MLAASGMRRTAGCESAQRPRQHSRLSGGLIRLVLLCPLASLGCEDALAPDEILSVTIAPSDSTIFAGDSLTFEAVVQYRSGRGEPDSVVWTVSNLEVLSLAAVRGARATVVGRERGVGYVFAAIDREFVDSAAVRVVRAGDLRWRTALSGGYVGDLPTPALDEQGRVFVVQFDVGPQYENNVLNSYSPSGGLVRSVPTCRATGMSPSVSPSGTAYITSWGCTQQHAPDGGVEWTVPFGTFDGGLAVAADGSVVALFDLWDTDTNEAHVVLSRIRPDGSEAWRDTLGLSSGPNYQKTAPLIASSGEVYVAWIDETGFWFSRVAADGVVRWTLPLPGWSKRSSPAIWDDRVAVTYVPGEVAAYDTSGVVLWRGTEPQGIVSSPVIDGQGNIYVQSFSLLVSYDAGGALRWSADSLGCPGCGPYGVGAPTLLQDDQLVVPCGWEDVCSVRRSDGSLVWRSVIGGETDGSPAVAPDGRIYVVNGPNELVALWNRVPPLIEGWPTEGGSAQRLRRQRQ